MSSLTELLVKPIRDNDPLQVRNIKALFDEGFFQLLAHNREVLEMTAEIRATQNLKMVDAIHAATAIHYQCDFIITADKTIQKRIIVFNKGFLGVLNKTGKHAKTTNQVNSMHCKIL